MQAASIKIIFLFTSILVSPFFIWAQGSLELIIKDSSNMEPMPGVGDSRQSKYTPLVTGPLNSPKFTSLWGPVEGRVINLAIKYSF